LGLSLGAVAVTLSRATKAGLDWPAAQALSDDELQLMSDNYFCRSRCLG
jgi:hypothetical protein